MVAPREVFRTVGSHRSQRRIEVWADWKDLTNSPRQVGVLYATPARGREIFSFEYDEGWLRENRQNAQVLDPTLQLFSGPQYPAGGRENFGMFLDSAPDRWGRVLMDRREAQAARTEARARKKLVESDYLLGVFDGNRMGGLRFKIDSAGPFLDDNSEFAAPPWVSLRELEFASFEIERPDAETKHDYARWLRMLIAPGGSLGGARPKAGVRDEKGHLWIAKFPAPRDRIDVGGWEHLAHVLAIRSGIHAADGAVRRFRAEHHTFLTRRFDRAEDGKRLHFASAMTLLGKSDGDDADSGASYLELAEFLMQYGAQTDRDLEELWRRIVFSICISNVDDHLRNHGFLLESAGPNGGWKLAPAYDLNPVAYGDGLKLNISADDNSQNLDLARQAAVFFRIKPAKANAIIAQIVGVAVEWRALADAQSIPRSEQEQMEPAFRVAEEAAHSL